MVPPLPHSKQGHGCTTAPPHPKKQHTHNNNNKTKKNNEETKPWPSAGLEAASKTTKATGCYPAGGREASPAPVPPPSMGMVTPAWWFSWAVHSTREVSTAMLLCCWNCRSSDDQPSAGGGGMQPVVLSDVGLGMTEKRGIPHDRVLQSFLKRSNQAFFFTNPEGSGGRGG